MFARSCGLFLLLAILVGASGCATSTPARSSRIAALRSVSVGYTAPPVRDRSGAIAGRVARHGAGFALGQLGFIGGLIGLGVDIAEIAAPGSDSGSGAEISSSALQLLQDSGTSPLVLVAQSTEREILRRQLFALAQSNPDGMFDLKLRRLQLDSADSRGLDCRASLAVTARLRSRTGATLWKKDAAATSLRTRTWRAYQERPRLARAEFTALAANVARQLLEDFPSRGPVSTR